MDAGVKLNLQPQLLELEEFEGEFCMVCLMYGKGPSGDKPKLYLSLVITALTAEIRNIMINPIIILRTVAMKV